MVVYCFFLEHILHKAWDQQELLRGICYDCIFFSSKFLYGCMIRISETAMPERKKAGKATEVVPGTIDDAAMKCDPSGDRALNFS
jgi:hypothetical protein